MQLILTRGKIADIAAIVRAKWMKLKKVNAQSDLTEILQAELKFAEGNQNTKKQDRIHEP